MKRLLVPALLLLNAALLGVRSWQEHPAHAGPPPVATVNGDTNGDGKTDISDAVYLLTALFLGGPAPVACSGGGGPSGLPDTGQNACYGSVRNVGWQEVPCDSAACQGQDAQYATGCPSENRFTDNGDGTVTDHCTGLMWQKGTADVNGDGQSNDQDSLPWCDALAYCENLSFAGHADWRLPNVRELQSIADYGRSNPSIDPVFGVLLDSYWSSTNSAGGGGVVWIVGFGSGGAGGAREGDSLYLRAVRSGP